LIAKAETPAEEYGPIALFIKLMNMDPEAIQMVQNLPKNGRNEIPKPVISENCFQKRPLW